MKKGDKVCLISNNREGSYSPSLTKNYSGHDVGVILDTNRDSTLVEWQYLKHKYPINSYKYPKNKLVPFESQEVQKIIANVTQNNKNYEYNLVAGDLFLYGNALHIVKMVFPFPLYGINRYVTVNEYGRIEIMDDFWLGIEKVKKCL